MTTASTSAPAETASRAEAAPFPVSMLAVTCLTATACIPLLATHLYQLWARPHYQFFPIVFLGAGILAYVRFPGVASLRAGAPAVGWGMLGFSWLLLAAGELLNSSYLGCLAALFLILAAMWAAGGAALVRQLLPVWLFLWLLVPLPFGLDNSLVLMLQRLTTRWSSSLLDQFGVIHVIAGNVVETGNRRLFVAEACAGINSLFSILTCAIFYVLFTRSGPIRSVLLILAAISWVLLANVLRVFLVAYLAKRFGIDLAEGWRHEALGYGLFAGALVLIWSTDRLLMFLTPARWRRMPAAPSSARHTAEETDGAAGLAGVRRSWMNSRAAGAAFGLLLACHLALYALPDYSRPAQASASVRLDQIDKAALPEKLDGWRCKAFTEETRNPGSALGEFSQVWAFHGNAQSGAFSFDHPFPSWHELQECYRNQGWEVADKADRVTTEPGAPKFFSERALKKAGMRHAHLFFCEFDRTGAVLEADRGGFGTALRRHESALGRLLAFTSPKSATAPQPVPPIYQFQLLVESDAPLSNADLSAAQGRFFKAYEALREKLID